MNTFKVGDWVKDIHSNELHVIIELFEDAIRVIKPLSKITFSNEYSDFELWKPEKEEVCLFWNSEDGIKVISRFYAFEHDGFTEAIEFKNYKFCAPYLC